MYWLSPRRTTFILIALVFVLRSPTLFDSMFLVDEGYSGAIASEMLFGGVIYENAVDTRAPFIYYVYYLVFLIAGPNNLFAVHLIASLFVLITALIVRELGSEIYGERSGAWAGIGYVIFSHTFISRDTLAANVEIFTLVPLTLGFLFYMKGERKDRVSLLLLGGACCAVSMFFRQPSVVNMAVIAVYLGFRFQYLADLSFRRMLRIGSAVFAGFGISVALIAWFHYSLGNLDSMVEWSWYIAMRYVNSETTLPYVLRRIFVVHVTFILAGGLLWYMGIGHLITAVREGVQKLPDSGGGILMVLWFTAAYMTLFTGWRFPGHYHLTLLPPLSVLAGAAFALMRNNQITLPISRIKRQNRYLLGATAVPALAFLIIAYFVRSDTVAFRPIPEYIIENTKPEDRIFVWGSAPHIYSFSHRRNATRFVSGSHLVGMYASRPHREIDSSKWIVPGSWEMLDQDFEEHPPELIIDMSPISSNWDRHPMTRYPVLKDHLMAYSLEESILGAQIYRRNNSRGSNAEVMR
ncbi:MAG: hypothetical protein HOH43_08790 [Candidatus Latescibacteria bacterium]|nr:hypothetical protein [Candidatus Latescibacterota bacterium]